MAGKILNWQRVVRWAALGVAIGNGALAAPIEERPTLEVPAAIPVAGPCPAGMEAIPLPTVADATATEVSKEISAPTIPLGVARIRSNWQTEWAVPGGESFPAFAITFAPETTGKFKAIARLKYGDDTEDEIHAPGAQEFVAGQPLYIRSQPRPTLQPYQVSLRVGSLNSGGYFYRAEAFGCRSQGEAIAVAAPVLPQACVPLAVVGGRDGQTTVRKKVNQPTIPGPFGIRFARSNWNTDWLVPPSQRFERFVATIAPEAGETGSFDIRLFLKYSDETADELYGRRDYDIGTNGPLEVAAVPRQHQQPYQVNLYVGGLEHIGNRYSATLQGCY